MLELLTPKFYVESVFTLDLADLKERGITTILSDLDNTLVPWDKEQVNPKLIKWVKKVKEADLDLILLSNAVHKRIDFFRQELGVPGVGKARKPLTRTFKRVLKEHNLSAHEVAMVGDQIFTDVLGANQLNIYSILVVPLSDKELAITRFFRKIERGVLRHLLKKGKIRGRTRVNN